MTLPASCLQFLRPYTWRCRPLGLRNAKTNAAYLRFFHSARQQELEQAEALKYPRIRHDAGTPMRIPAFRNKFDHVQIGQRADEVVVVRGRVQHIRRAGSKLVFFELRSEFERVQGMCNLRILEEAEGVTRDDLKAFARRVNRGDIVSVVGRAVRSESGELTIEATRTPDVISPALVPMPFKLADEQARIQHRHIDMLVNRRTMDTLRMRSALIKYVRDFFHDRDFLEFQTPILTEKASGAVARPFVTVPTESLSSKEVALRIAPELWLKRLVVGGVDKVFELGPAFRNEGIDQTHNPEFTMCEFYSAYSNLDDLIKLTEEFLSGMAAHCQALITDKLVSLPKIRLENYTRPFKQMEFIPSLETALQCKLPDLTSESAKDELIKLLQAKGGKFVVPNADQLTLPALLDRLASTYIEPHSRDAPLFITHHPVCMSPLAKSFVCPKTGQAVSARAEFFVEGKELANMYEEENDPAAQRAKFTEQARRHHDPETAAVGGRTLPDGEVEIDESYCHALESALPPTGGWGCGIERLVMLFASTRRISDVLPFGNLRHVVGVTHARGHVTPASDKEGEAGETKDDIEA